MRYSEFKGEPIIGQIDRLGEVYGFICDAKANRYYFNNMHLAPPKALKH
jgi:hypothetical protein